MRITAGLSPEGDRARESAAGIHVPLSLASRYPLFANEYWNLGAAFSIISFYTKCFAANNSLDPTNNLGGNVCSAAIDTERTK